VIDGDWGAAAELAKSAIQAGEDPRQIIHQQLQPAMGEVGERFSSGEYFLPDMLAAGRAMTNALEILKPLLGDTTAATAGKILIGTVQGDVHDIGKNMVSMFLKGTGFEVVDLGIDVAAERFVDEVRKQQPDLLGLSALLTTTMPYLGTVIKALEEAGVRSLVKVVVGGAPVTQGYADLIGADAYANDAGEAAGTCKRLVGV